MHRRLWLFLVVAWLGAPLQATTTSVVPPATVWGVLMIDGSPAPDGAPLSASIAGVEYASTIVFSNEDQAGLFVIDIPGDDPNTPDQIEGGQPGQTISFATSNATISATGVWEIGAVIHLDLQAVSKSNDPLPLVRVSVSSALPGWPAERLIDGTDSLWSSNAHGEHLSSAEWLILFLAEPATVDRLRILPRANPTDPTLTLGFPKDFVIQFSPDCSDRSAIQWRPLLSLFGYPQPRADWLEFQFAPKAVACLLIVGAELSQDDYGYRYFQLDELELYASETKISVADVQVSSALPNWLGTYLIDGVGSLWSSRAHGEHLASAEWVIVFLASPTSVDRLRILPRANPADPALTLGFPKDFVIQYSPDCANRSSIVWRPILSFFGYTQPAAGWVEFEFAPKVVDCILIVGAELSQDDYGYRYLQLNEIEMYAGAAQANLTDVLVSSALPDWPALRLIDGEDSLWSSNAHGEHLSGAEWAIVFLATPANIGRLRVLPRANPTDPDRTLGFPKDFVIQYASNCEDMASVQWRPVLSLFGYPQPQNDWVEFQFPPKAMACVLVLGGELSQDDYGYRYLQLNEIEVYTE